MGCQNADGREKTPDFTEGQRKSAGGCPLGVQFEDVGLGRRPWRCIGRVHIDKPASKIKLDFRVIPSASLAGSVAISKSLDAS